MSSQRIKRAFESSVSGSSSRANASLEQIQLAVEINFMVGPETVQSVHPWGFIVPGEVVANDATVLATIEAHRVPVGTTFIVRLVPDDGSTPYETRVLHVGPNPVEFIKLPNAWLMPLIGRTVYLGYEAEWPDGTRAEGPGLEFQITPLLEIPPIRFEGLEPGKPLDPAEFPSGLVATIGPIAQIRSFHRAALYFTVLGTREGYISTITVRGYTLEGLEDHPVRVTIDPAAYSGHYEDGYSDVYAMPALHATLVPRPNPHGVEPFMLGRLDVLPPLT
jgi:hypothetical protein